MFDCKRTVSLAVFAASVGCFALSSAAFGCANTFGTTPDGEQVNFSIGEGVFGELTHTKFDRHHQLLDRKEELLRDAPNDFKAKNDLAVLRMYEGDLATALKILQEVERDHPGHYVVAANLGTAYELSGDLEQALHWIREGIKRNADAHDGTEWLHVRILEAKRELAADPKWLKNHSILRLQFGGGIEPVKQAEGALGPDGVRLSVEETIRALVYQLHERMHFVKAPDPIVAELLFDLANLTIHEQGVEQALKVYELAIEYRPTQLELAKSRSDRCIAVMAAHAEPTQTKKRPLAYIGVPMTVAVAMAVGLFIYHGRRERALRIAARIDGDSAPSA